MSRSFLRGRLGKASSQHHNSAKSNINELQSDINGHNRVWLVAERRQLVLQRPQVLNQTIQTLNASYNETYHKSYTVRSLFV